ncbi:carboxypeptidase regulatory-like domain-containing protein [Enterobacteriaceae bacterium BIT-l23]|uniref:carboxypeptidase regulatory-like domain-containing protein n=1 Tax=Jejubacter sp. L23 TaxID=3092086 RepID=UPI001584BBEE|nr:carboxypeptidase regulatory-like domain-containing protein [Enterobacteriaceae bacterium BIT-l23]
MHHTALRNGALSTIAALLLTVSLSGCVFHDYNSPHIEGVILNQGQPVADVPVILTNVDKQVRITTTDSLGRFTLAPPGEWHLLIPIGPQDRLSRWAVIIEQGQKTLTGYTESRFGGVFSGYSGRDRIRLICELSPKSDNASPTEKVPLC